MNNLLFSLAMAALGQFTGLGGGGFSGGGFAGPGIGISGLGIPGRGLPGQGMPGLGSPGYGSSGYGGPGGIAIAPSPYGASPYGASPYGASPMSPGYSGNTSMLQLASVTAARCLEQTGQLAPGESNSLLRNQGRTRGWTDGWQQRISRSQSERLLSRYGGCDGLLTALRQGRLAQERTGTGQPGQGSRGGGLISQQPYGLNPSQPGNPPDSEPEGFGLAPYR